MITEHWTFKDRNNQIISDCIRCERQPLWSSGQSSWLDSQRSGFDSWCYQIFREVVDLERSPLSLMSTIEELLGRRSSSSGLENRDYGSKDPPRWPRGTLCPQKMALTSPTSGGCLVGIVCPRTKATELLLFSYYAMWSAIWLCLQQCDILCNKWTLCKITKSIVGSHSYTSAQTCTVPLPCALRTWLCDNSFQRVCLRPDRTVSHMLTGKLTEFVPIKQLNFSWNAPKLCPEL
jgi:hypothetical protein